MDTFGNRIKQRLVELHLSGERTRRFRRAVSEPNVGERESTMTPRLRVAGHKRSREPTTRATLSF